MKTLLHQGLAQPPTEVLLFCLERPVVVLLGLSLSDAPSAVSLLLFACRCQL